MSISTRYPTGTDYQIYLSDALRGIPDAETAGALPDFEAMTPLDVKNVTIVEDGQITPLFHISRQTADHFCYSRRVVNGQLQMNFSEEYLQRHRSPLQTMRDKTLWVVLDYVDWVPPRRVRDVYRIGAVWEHAFNHEPQPHAAEQVPFSGRDLTLISRRTAAFDQAALDEFTREDGPRQVEANDLFRERNNRYLGTVQSVTDGDTLDVKIDSTGQTITVRLPVVDTPETSSSGTKGNTARYDYTRYRWPSDASRPSGYSGDADRPVQPSQSQLDKWGQFVADEVRKWLPQGEKVWLVTDQGAAPQEDAFDGSGGGRYLFRIDRVKNFSTSISGSGTTVESTNLGKHLVRLGYAQPFNSDSIAEIEGQYRSISADVEDTFRSVRKVAGTSEARGIFYHPDHNEWKTFAGL